MCPAGSLAHPAGLTFFLKKIKERERDLFSGIFILKSEFFYVVKKNIPISYLEYPVFDATAANIHIYQNLFSCVLHTANTLTCFERSFFYTKNIGSFENVFSHWFLKHNKYYFLGIISHYTSLKEASIIIEDISIFYFTVYEPWEYKTLRQK